MKIIPKYALTLLVLVSFIGLYFWQRDVPSDHKALKIDQKNKGITVASKTEGQEEEPLPLIVVDVKGEVAQPGVYELKEGKRVQDAVEVAGGMTDQADPLSVNLAQKLIDEMVVYVNTVQKKDGKISSNSYSEKISLNRASLKDLTSLAGIGEAKAKKIIKYREEHGPFNSVDELLKVSGIGEKTLQGFRDHIRAP